jgi:hypothetical protein
MMIERQTAWCANYWGGTRQGVGMGGLYVGDLDVMQCEIQKQPPQTGGYSYVLIKKSLSTCNKLLKRI